MRLWSFLCKHVWKQCKCVTGLRWWCCTELPPSVMDLLLRYLNLHSSPPCLCWRSAFLPFLSADMLWCSLSNISLFLSRSSYQCCSNCCCFWMLFDCSSPVPSCLSTCSHGDAQQNNETPDFIPLSEIIIREDERLSPSHCCCLEQLVNDTLYL